MSGRVRASVRRMGARYKQPLDVFKTVRLSVEFTTRRDEVIGYALILIAELGGRIETIRVYDSAQVMDAAIELAIKGRSPYPSRASFVNHDAPNLAKEVAAAFDDDSAVVLVWPDGSSRVLQPGDQIPAPAPSAALKASGSGIDLPAS